MEQEESNSKKSNKKSKSKKPKPTPVDDNSSSNELVIVDDNPITLKPVLVTKSTPNKLNTSLNANNHKKRKKRDSASSDEERWLTAIESGKLEDVDDELKKIKPKDPALMTARQRAMYDRSSDPSTSAQSNLMSLPTGYKEKVMTAEAIQKAAIKSQKRKQLADEKREKDKKKTMERLLKKQDSKALKQPKMKTTKTNVPLIMYKQNSMATFLLYPEGVDFPLKPVKAPEPLKPMLCGMGCGKFKKYACSKTGVPLCSLECYKQNLSGRII
ncbi:INO80 complex subunit B [Anthonomus grandis grandis]|uniref:INO80 complex subunit B n=1 Tax=Anthonomus grandis grandis TaxID=2921223 RepID=UPI002165097A|nr:INO80 complex subunit B [Anthonomus grandis grandis]